MNTCQQGVNQGSTVSDRNPSPLMIISGGVWHTYDVTRPEHEMPRLGLKHPRGCVQQVHTSLVLDELLIYSDQSWQRHTQVSSIVGRLANMNRITSAAIHLSIAVCYHPRR